MTTSTDETPKRENVGIGGEDVMNQFLDGSSATYLSLRVFPGDDDYTPKEPLPEVKKKEPGRRRKMFIRRFVGKSPSRFRKEKQKNSKQDEGTTSNTTSESVVSKSPFRSRRHREEKETQEHDKEDAVPINVRILRSKSQSPSHHRRVEGQPMETRTRSKSASDHQSRVHTSHHQQHSQQQTYNFHSSLHSKLDATHCIFLGYPGQEKTFSSEHVRKGLKISCNYFQQTYQSSSDSRGCLILEGPPPVSQNKYQPSSHLWKAPITFSKKYETAKTNTSNQHTDYHHQQQQDQHQTAMEALQQVHTDAHHLIQKSKWDEAADLLAASFSNIMKNCTSQTMYQKLKRMIFRNIGTIKLVTENYDEAAYYFSSAAGSQIIEDEKKQKVISDDDRIDSALDLSTSLSLHALSLYALEKYNTASEALMMALEVVRKLYMDGNQYKLPQDDNLQNYYISCKLLNNLGCCVSGMGLLKSATRSFHRAILVFMTGFEDPQFLENGYVMGEEIASRCERLKHCHSLSATLKYIQAKCPLSKIIPRPFMLNASITLINLAFVLNEMDEMVFSIICMKQAFLLQRQILHKSHQLVLSTAESLAFLYVMAGESRKAIKIYESILKMDEHDFLSNGNQNYTAVMLKTMTDLYLVYKQMNKMESAIWCLRGVLAHHQSATDPDIDQIQQIKKTIRSDMEFLSEQIYQQEQELHKI